MVQNSPRPSSVSYSFVDRDLGRSTQRVCPCDRVSTCLTETDSVDTSLSLDSGAIGPVTVMKSFTDTFGELSASQHGLVISSILISATIASLFAGAFSDSLGRPRAIAIGALVFAIGAALEAGAVDLAMLIVGRLIVGAGEGIFLSVIVV